MINNKVTINTPTTELGIAVDSVHMDLDFSGYPMIDDTKSLQSCLTLCDPTDSSLPGSAIHGIFQARVLEWGAIAFSNA